MTHWGILLLCAYMALGATHRLTQRQAGAAALAVTVIVIAVALVGYASHTPTDKYIPFVDAPVYGTGQPPPPGIGSTATSEDVTGVKAANWFTTDHNASGGN